MKCGTAITDAPDTKAPNTQALEWRRLTAADVDRAVALNVEAGWNQTAADWRFMLDQGEGTGIWDNNLVATSMLLPQQEGFAWIAMILVTAQRQRQGLASELMRRCLDRAQQLNLIPGLDATEAGRKVYLPLEFRDIYPLTRWQADNPVAGESQHVRPMRRDDLERVSLFDAAIAGTPRQALLAHLFCRCPDRAFVVEMEGAIQGFVLARDGRLATQIGPLSANRDDVAFELLQASLGAGPVFLDAADHHTGFAEGLARLGFRKQRGYVRMLLGRDTPLDDPARVFLIAGPELG